jgi:hypothetical protein
MQTMTEQEYFDFLEQYWAIFNASPKEREKIVIDSATAKI